MITFNALDSADVRRIRRERIDSYGNPVEVHVSDGEVYPCRHCLGKIAQGKESLVLAHRPFKSRNPYAETGPIFFCAEACTRPKPSNDLPGILLAPEFIVRGYDSEERIIYGTGKVTATSQIKAYATDLLTDPQVAFVDIRSARNNCFQCRVHRA